MLSEAEEIELENLMRDELRDRCLESFPTFAKHAWEIIEPGTPYVDGWHVHAIAEHLVAMLHLQIRNLVINMPPRHMKSTLISVLFPAWVWLKLPHMKWLFTTYAESLSKRDSIKCRLLIESNWYRSLFKPTWGMSADQNEKLRFKNTSEGYRLSSSVGGSATGEGGDFLVADDPHNAKEIHSDLVRKGVLTWWDEVMSSRGNDPKTVRKIIVMQRLHEEDLSGHVLKKGGYDLLLLPAEFEPERKVFTSIGWSDPRTMPGQLLWPERFGPEEIKGLKKDLGSQAAAGQLQQSPSSEGGNIFKRQWWKFYTVRPARVQRMIQSWDLSTKDKENSSNTVGLVMAQNGADKYVFDCVADIMDFPSQCTAIVALSSKWPLTRKKLVEDKANGPAVISTLKKKIPGLVPVEPDGDKVARANACSPEVEAGNVWLPDPSIAPWVSDFITELANFPNSAKNDRVDAFSQGMMELAKPIIVGTPTAGHGSGAIHG